ncbi:hypothetical protein [Streptomyces chrestomyceticus]|uniref:hypothetical protein n=1 Tax=Streptomyces chrestomyceticus TaxID=68185 RepID=UPI0033C1F98C
MTELTVSIDDRLAEQVAESAAQHGLAVNDYVASVLAAAQAMKGTDRADRAAMLARFAYRQWDNEGRPEDGAMSMAEVFGR